MHASVHWAAASNVDTVKTETYLLTVLEQYQLKGGIFNLKSSCQWTRVRGCKCLVAYRLIRHLPFTAVIVVEARG